MSRPRVVYEERISLGPKRGACKVSGAMRIRFEKANSNNVSGQVRNQSTLEVAPCKKAYRRQTMLVRV